MQNEDIERIRDALHSIPASDRDTWLRMGMGIKAELGEGGFDMWDQWSQQDESYDPAAARSVWKSIKANGKVTIGTVYHQARENGWRDDGTIRVPTSEELAERRRAAAERTTREEGDISRERAATASRALILWGIATEAASDHPYLQRKNVWPVATLREIDAEKVSDILGYAVKSGGEPLIGSLLVVPVKVSGKLSTVELIDGAGRKAALAGRGSKFCGFWAAQPLPDGNDEGITLLIGEGVATVLSARQASGHPGLAALSNTNLRTVAQTMRDRYPEATLVILADLVKATGAPDPHAIEAARLAAGKLAVPSFGTDRPPSAKDFNDMAGLCGAESVSQAIADARGPEAPLVNGAATPVAAIDGWPEPQPLIAKIEPEPYPVDALPPTLRAAVQEVADFVKAPIPLVASSALAALSLAAQAHIDVKRADKLEGPVGLFLLTIADSGERKSTCDGFFTASIRKYQQDQTELMKSIVERHRAAIDAWTAERDGLLSAIKDAGKKGKAIDKMKVDLTEIQLRKPRAPRVPRLLLGDDTPENLAFRLATEWPSGGVVSAEAGIILGAHAMGKDSAMRNLALHNVLWDGGELSIGRRTSESFVVAGARLTVALQIQEATLRGFIARTGELARGIGWFARCLISWPQSTQGLRPFSEAPSNWPKLEVFHHRIEALLANPVPIDDDGTLSPALMILATDTKKAWVEFHDALEAELVSGGELYDVRDVASKTADNAARLAALFQIFEHGFGGVVQLDAFEGASRVAAWHLHESRRFFGEVALPAELADAVRLDRWLSEYCRRSGSASVGKNYVRQHGPLRDQARLDAAIRELRDLVRLRLHKDSRRQTIELNPALMELRR
jgi:putative DNA primase/helicase